MPPKSSTSCWMSATRLSLNTRATTFLITLKARLTMQWLSIGAHRHNRAKGARADHLAYTSARRAHEREKKRGTEYQNLSHTARRKRIFSFLCLHILGHHMHHNRTPQHSSSTSSYAIVQSCNRAILPHFITQLR